jgi:mannose-6-phosphate isomerase-like protein (cupin superfamily)
MRRLVLAIAIVPIGYFICAALIHYILFRESPIPEVAYPRSGAVYSSNIEGLEAQVLHGEHGRDLKRVRVRPGAAGPPEHVHLELQEDFHLIEGELVVVLDGVERVVKAGEWARVPPHTPHRFFNRSNSTAVYELDAPRSHTLFTSQIYGFTNEYGSLADHPARALLQMSRFHADTWRPTVPIRVQRFLYFSVEPTARLLGYRRFYPQYVPQPVGASVPASAAYAVNWRPNKPLKLTAAGFGRAGGRTRHEPW